MKGHELRDFATLAGFTAGAGSMADALKTALVMGGEALLALSGHGEQPESVERLALGTARVARDFFHHDPPTSHEIERAIDFVEDQLMSPGRPVAGGRVLFSSSPAWQPWAAVSGPTMTVEIVEQWFQRLALASHGQTGAMQGLPAGREAAAALLVLREFMHHRGHASITVVDPRQTLVDVPPPA